jgi:hypothetical protein
LKIDVGNIRPVSVAFAADDLVVTLVDAFFELSTVSSLPGLTGQSIIS